MPVPIYDATIASIHINSWFNVFIMVKLIIVLIYYNYFVRKNEEPRQQ